MMTSTTASDTTRASGSLWSYRTIDLLFVVAIGVVFGVAFRGYGFLYVLVDPATTAYRPLVGLLAGFWFVPAIVAALIVRRPGAALIAEMLAAFLEMMLAGQWGAGTLISGLLQGLGVEVAFLIFAYRRFGLPIAMLGGVLAAVFEWFYERFWYYAAFSTPQALVLLIFFIISGILLGGLLSWFITRQLSLTGALDSMPAGRSKRAHRTA